MAKIRVDQKDGEIIVAYQGDEPVRYNVTDGQVTVKNEDVPMFLDSVAGSLPADARAKELASAADPSAPAV